MRKELQYWSTRGGLWSIRLEEDGERWFNIREYKHGKQQAASCNIQSREQAEAEMARRIADAAKIDNIHYKRVR